MFNDIRSESTETLLTANEYQNYSKDSDYIIKEFSVPGDSNNMQVSVVWTNKIRANFSKPLISIEDAIKKYGSKLKTFN